jgi:hypothetical protein
LLQDIRRRASRNGGEPGILKSIVRGGAQILVGNIEIPQANRQIKLAQQFSHPATGAGGVINRPDPLHWFTKRRGNLRRFFGISGRQ